MPESGWHKHSFFPCRNSRFRATQSGRDFRGWTLILKYVTALLALTFSLINSTRPRQPESRVCGYPSTLCTSVFIKGRLIYRMKLFVRVHPSAAPFIAMYICARAHARAHTQAHTHTHTHDTCADNLNTADRCLLVRRSTYDREDGSVSRPLLSRDYDLVSPKAGYQLDGSTSSFSCATI